MDKKIIINIGREFGSCGHEIGREVAERLGIEFYDKELLDRASKESGISKEIFQIIEERQTNSFLYNIAMGAFAGRLSAEGTVSLSDRLFMVQYDIIKKIASEGSCVIVGRCSDYILKDEENNIKIFIYADFEERIKTVMVREGLDEKKAKDLIIKTDKKRGAYYNYYTNQKWGGREFYDLLINSAALGKEGSVDLILKYIDIRLAAKQA